MSQFPIKKIMLYFLFGILWASCNTQERSMGEKKAGSFNQLNLPEGLKSYSLNPDSLILDSLKLTQHSNYKIYAFIDVSCPSCIADIDQWNKIHKDFLSYNVPIILICYSKGNFEYLKYLFESNQIKSFPYPIYLDMNHQLFEGNRYLKEKTSHYAILTDKNNNILIEGNPLFSTKVKNEYYKLITH